MASASLLPPFLARSIRAFPHGWKSFLPAGQNPAHSPAYWWLTLFAFIIWISFTNFWLLALTVSSSMLVSSTSCYCLEAILSNFPWDFTNSQCSAAALTECLNITTTISHVKVCFLCHLALPWSQPPPSLPHCALAGYLALNTSVRL